MTDPTPATMRAAVLSAPGLGNQRVLDRIAAGALELLAVHTYSLEDIAAAHRDIARGARRGKLVGLPWD